MIRIIDKFGNIKNSIQSLSVNADWLAVSGPSEILNKPTSTSSFINDGADGINPYITALSIPLATSSVAGILKLYSILGNNTDGAVTQALLQLYLEPQISTGTIISFERLKEYDFASPSTGNITNDLTGAKKAIIQTIYHNDAVIPTFPGGWVLIGGEYKVSELNIIFAEWISGARVNYWITQEL